MDSGKFTGAGYKSNFSQTCTLLSQYLKENGSFGDLSLGLSSSNLQSHGVAATTSTNTTATTKNLLPMIETSGPGRAVEPEKAQMTIFYEGQVLVFDDFPAFKAEEIMSSMLATQNPNYKTFATCNMPEKPKESSSWAAPNIMSSEMFSETFINDMPIMRKASLAKFFEKRQDRLTARAPYSVRKPGRVTSRRVDDKSNAWLALAAQSSSPMQN